ncbi:MAG TPA: hypothetical protein VM925_15155, partial [Labilithrix sp.]|nr:hypothetical protein [Labilithrix sp.]
KTPPEKKPVTVSDLFQQDEEPPPPPKKPPPPPRPDGPEPRWNWLSVRAMFDFAYLSDANICSPGAPSSYFCTDERGARYTGRPQRNDDISPGFGFSVARLVLGYERLLFAGLTAGAFAGYAFNFAPSAEGRTSGFPLNLEARATYTFGRSPYVDGAGRLHPFVFVSAGAADFDTHVIIRVNEKPCPAKSLPACYRDLNAYRLVGSFFATLGGGVRYQLQGRHALRAAMRATMVLGDGAFVLSPELAYEFGL